MKHFVRFAKPTVSGTIARPGWKLRLFPTSAVANAFAKEMVSGGWRAEAGDLDDEALKTTAVSASADADSGAEPAAPG